MVDTGLYGDCRACCPGVSGVGLLCSYGLLLLCYYVIIDVVVLVVHPRIVFEAAALVVDAILAILLLCVMVIDYSGHISLSMVKVFQRNFDSFGLRRIASVQMEMRIQYWVEVLYRQDRVNVPVWGNV